MDNIYDPCKCGSGKKYKWCCYQKDRAQKVHEASGNSDAAFEEEFAKQLQNMDADAVRASLLLMQQRGKLATYDDATHLLDRLIYHNLGEVGADFLAAINLTKTAGDHQLIEWTREGFHENLAFVKVLSLLQKDPDRDRTLLMKEFEKQGQEMDEEELGELIDSTLNWRLAAYTTRDFNLQAIAPDEDDIPEELSEQLFKLNFAFTGYAAEIQGESFIRAHFAGTEILTYLIDRACGELDEEGDGSNHLFTDSRFFYPDAITLRNYFSSKIFSLTTPSYYAAAIVLDLLPSWLSFLKEKKLIHEEKARSTLKGLRKLADEIYGSCATVIPAPVLSRGLSRWEL
jgi:hypothetical protein